MKIKEAKEVPQYKISGVRGKRGDRVAMYHEKDDENIKHGTYKTKGGAFYNRYNVRDVYGEGDELSNRGVVGPFKTQEEAEQSMKDYRPNAIKESMRRYSKRRIKENKEDRVDVWALAKDIDELIFEYWGMQYRDELEGDYDDYVEDIVSDLKTLKGVEATIRWVEKFLNLPSEERTDNATRLCKKVLRGLYDLKKEREELGDIVYRRPRMEENMKPNFPLKRNRTFKKKINEGINDKMHIKDLTQDEVCDLRKEVKLGSYSYKDYRNSFNVDIYEAGNFFDGYLNYICGMYEKKHNTNHYDFKDVFDEYDNVDTLKEYFNSI